MCGKTSIPHLLHSSSVLYATLSHNLTHALQCEDYAVRTQLVLLLSTSPYIIVIHRSVLLKSIFGFRSDTENGG